VLFLFDPFCLAAAAKASADILKVICTYLVTIPGSKLGLNEDADRFPLGLLI
jgi:hypothetical protein